MAGLPSGAGALVGQRLGKYEILALLALGGTAEIYLARVDGTDGFEKYVVVKCLHDHLAEDPDFVSMFLDEARLGAVLDHSNIVQTLGLGQHDDRYYMVMEYITGLSMALVGRRAHERVRGGKVPVALVLNMAAQACGGLHYAHERIEGGKPLNLVHRDISPQNLVITFEGIVKVVDFGIAKAEYRETRTRSGTVKGKFAYMSPEQCQAGDVDRRTDVFAMGVIMWELLTGRRLFKRDSTYETYQAVVECAVPPLSAINHELDPALDGIVMMALARDRKARYPTAEAFGEALMGYLHQRGKPSGAGEIARFFEECFAQEIEDSFVRMRELIEGRRKSVADQKLLQWDSSELDGSAQVLAPEDFELLDDSVSTSRPEQLRAMSTSTPAPSSGAVGTVSPPRASISTRMNTVPERPARISEPPALPPLAEPVPPDTVDVEDDFDGDPLTDVEAWKNEESPSSDRTKVQPPHLSALPHQAAEIEAAAARRQPTAPPRKPGAVLTPPGLRAGGAPLDPLPHEQVLSPVPTPPPSQAPPTRQPTSPPRPALFGTSNKAAVATVLAPLPGTARSRAPTAPQPIPGGRFADAPTVHDVNSAVPRPVPEAGSKPRFADAATVLSAPARAVPRAFVDAKTVVPTQLTAPPPRAASEPTVEQTQMLVANDLVEVTPGPAPLPTLDQLPTHLPPLPTQLPPPTTLPPPVAQDMVSLPAIGDVYPGHPYYGHNTVPSGPRNWPPWVLGVMFVLVLAIATGITVAIARAVT